MGRKLLVTSLGALAVITAALFGFIYLNRKTDAEKLLEVVQGSDRADAMWAFENLLNAPDDVLDGLLPYLTSSSRISLKQLSSRTGGSLRCDGGLDVGDLARFVVCIRCEGNIQALTRFGVRDLKKDIADRWERYRTEKGRSLRSFRVYWDQVPPSRSLDLFSIQARPERLLEMLIGESRPEAIWALERLKELDDVALEGLLIHAWDGEPTPLYQSDWQIGSTHFPDPPYSAGQLVRLVARARMGLSDEVAVRDVFDLKDRWRAYRAQGR
jgi:hypothetical protein